jgi:hypothetical protein
VKFEEGSGKLVGPSHQHAAAKSLQAALALGLRVRSHGQRDDAERPSFLDAKRLKPDESQATICCSGGDLNQQLAVHEHRRPLSLDLIGSAQTGQQS